MTETKVATIDFSSTKSMPASKHFQKYNNNPRNCRKKTTTERFDRKQNAFLFKFLKTLSAICKMKQEMFTSSTILPVEKNLTMNAHNFECSSTALKVVFQK